MDSIKEYEDCSEDGLSDLFLAIQEEEAKAAVLNVHRFKEFKFAYGVLANLLVNPDMRLKYELHEPFKSMGSISVEGKELNFTQAEWFSRVSQFADVTDVCPLANGGVRLTFTFHNMTIAVE